MQKVVVVGPDVVFCEAGGKIQQTDLEGLGKLIQPAKPCVIGVVPVMTAVITAAEQTLDAAMGTRFPAGHTLRSELIGPSQYQAFAIENELFKRLRALGRSVQVVPYSAATRHVVDQSKQKLNSALTRMTRVFTRAELPDASSTQTNETVVVDGFSGGFVVTAVREKQILAGRRIQGGDFMAEITRTIASGRMTTPQLLCSDQELMMELKANGFMAKAFRGSGPLVGWAGLEHVPAVRFLHAKELAYERQTRSRAIAARVVVGSAVVLIGGAGARGYTYTEKAKADRERASLASQKTALDARAAELFVERTPAIERRKSVMVHAALFDMILALPAQVRLVSIESNENQIVAVVDRMADAAPFGRTDLQAALTAFPGFSKVTIREEYQGHVVRYILNIPVEPK